MPPVRKKSSGIGSHKTNGTGNQAPINSNTKLSVYEFGEKLIELNDLDPVYVVLWEGKLGNETLNKWLLAYWCFYHSGTASWITDQPDYWKAMEMAAASKEWPRSPERRHFRGGQATEAVEWLRSRGLDKLMTPLWGNDFKLDELLTYVKKWKRFGPWISFKVADMVERLALSRVEFDEGAMFLFDSPKEGSKLMWSLERDREPLPNEAEKWAVEKLKDHFWNVKAPPRYERVCGAQEVETILCKWKSYMGGHYKLGEDVESLKKALEHYKVPTAEKLIQGGHKGGLW